MRLHGGFWHPECLREYRNHRRSLGYNPLLNIPGSASSNSGRPKHKTSR